MITQPQAVPAEMKQTGELLALGFGALLAGIALGWWVRSK